MRTTSDFSEGPTIGWLAPPTPVVKRLMIINGVMFLTQLLARLYKLDFFEHYLALSGNGQRSFMIWQFVTYMFLHDPGSIWHILFNMLALWMFGRDVEHEIGPYQFLKLYLLGGIVGGFFWLAFNFHSTSYVIGASGAVLAVCIAFATLFPERPITILLFFLLPLTMKAKYWAWATVALVAYGCFRVTGNVADLAHLGGIVVGYLYVKWLGYGVTPGWIAAVHRLVNPRRQSRSSERDEFHSSRPGVAYNHPYRSFDEDEVERSAPRKSVLRRMLLSREAETENRVEDKDEYIRKEIDPILDKIARQGMGSLTRRERRILESAKDKIDRRR